VSTATATATTKTSNINGPLFVELTEDHRPDNPSERRRIESARGVVTNNRVDSKLAVSRAFGDCTLKNDESLQFRHQRVTSLTERRSVVAAEGDALFLFCDGLVEYLDNERLVESLCRHIPLYRDPVYALGFLLDEVLEGGSRDNMSAVLVQFGDGAEYGLNGREKTFLPGPLYLARNDRKYVAAYLSNAKDFGHRDSPQLRRAAYREDLKLIRKYGRDRCGHDGQRDIVREIERVIRDIDGHRERHKNGDGDGDGGSSGGAEEREIERRRSRGSTEVIRDEEDHEMKEAADSVLAAQDMTPPLSDVEEDGDDGNARGVDDESKSAPELDGDGKPQMTRKRTFADLDGAGQPEFATKRRKSNIGKAIVATHSV